MNENASRTAAAGCEEMLAGSLTSFKGFAETPSTPPACGIGWSTAPGNNSGPPSGIRNL
jgi:hypothetical protein